MAMSSATLKASSEVALHIAKAKKPRTIAEDFIFPSVVNMVKAVLGEHTVSKMRAIALSNTISCRISVMPDDNEQLIKMLKASKFAVQLDDSTDAATCSRLVCFDDHPVNVITEEEFLLSEELPT